MSFEITADGRLGFLIERYSAVEFQDLIAYRTSTHRFAVPPALIPSDPYLVFFVVEKKEPSISRWHWILQLFLIATCAGVIWICCWIHTFSIFPSESGLISRANLADSQFHRREPADLIDDLAKCDAADPWHTHYRLRHAGRPARRIERLVVI
ncbi:hypothetical protein PHMEG_0006856 [Phytophthora megakarya]|uniref:Uncharacterized protein n=1 Tax=Phytophthora megakarya TaxID=4795 RepID=A0A225WNT8_9STRA|nr:hypothetical protein PHMEG_0006856 [Phytophthora megakarya]